VSHLVSNLIGYDRLADDTREVLDTLIAKDVEVQTKSGFWYAMRLMPYRTLDNVIEGAVLTFVDIDALKRTQEALEENEALYRALVTASADVVYRMNPDWSEMRELHGRDFIPDTDSPSRAWLKRYILAEDQPKVLAAINEAIKTKSTFRLEHRVIRVDASPGWTSSRAVPLLDADGAIVQWVGTATDISEHKTAEEELAQDLKAMELQSEIGSAFVRREGPEILLQKIVDAAVAAAHADMGTIQLVDSASGTLQIKAHHGFEKRWIDYWQNVGKGKGVCGTAMEKGERVVVEDVVTSPIFEDPEAQKIMREAGVKAVISTPLTGSDGRAIGMFSVHYILPHKPKERELNRLDVIGRLAVDVIERIRADGYLGRGKSRA